MAKQTFTTGQVLTAAQMTSLQQTAMLGGAASAKTASYTLVAADAGTAISMSSASATTITVNTALFAAGDTVQITNLGAGVCTITAGTATVNTSASLALAQYESGTLYFTSTSAAIFIKGQGAASGGGSGLVFIGRTSYSSVSSVSFNNVFTSTYTNYVTYNQFTSTSANTSDVFIRMRLSGTDSTTANYNTGFAGTDRGNVAQKYAQSDSTNGYKVAAYESTETAQNLAFKVDFMSPTTVTRQQIFFQTCFMDNTGAFVYGAGAGSRTSSPSAADGFTIRSTSGTFSGYSDVYGLAKA
jgi:hypothetical protein